MTKTEWITAAATITAAWPGRGLTREQIDASYPLMAPLDCNTVAAAVMGFVDAGGAFPPAPAELRGWVAATPAEPDWTEAWGLICAGIRRFPARRNAELLASLPAVVADFAVATGVDRLRQWPTEDPFEGPVIRATLAKQYREHVAARAERRLLGQGAPDGELPGASRGLPAGFLRPVASS